MYRPLSPAPRLKDGRLLFPYAPGRPCTDKILPSLVGQCQTYEGVVVYNRHIIVDAVRSNSIPGNVARDLGQSQYSS